MFLRSLIPGERADLRVESHLPLLFHTRVPGIPAFKDRGREERWWQRSQMAEERSHEQMLARCRLPSLRLRQHKNERTGYLVLVCLQILPLHSWKMCKPKSREDPFIRHEVWLSLADEISCIVSSLWLWRWFYFPKLETADDATSRVSFTTCLHSFWNIASENVGGSWTFWANII